MNHKLPVILAIAMAMAALSLFLSDRGFGSAEPVEVQEPIPHRDVEVQEPIPHRDVEVQEPIPHRDEVFATIRTYTPPQNIYLPEMMFLVVKDTNSLGIRRCKNMAYRTIDSFSRRVNSNLVRADKKLATLARIVYNECIDVTIDAHRKGL